MTSKNINNQSVLNSTWTESLANNQRPDGKALLAHLRTVHKNNAGFTEKCPSICRDKAGRNSYEWLAEIVPNTDGIRVLDLACGSGPLLKILYDRNKNLRLKGVDMCPEELALAKARLPDGVVDLFELKAQNLKAIDDNSIDVVLCHWALTLMKPITPVLNEVSRVLSSGGRFAALVDGPMNAAPKYSDVHNLIYRFVQAKLPKYGEIDLGDPRIRSTDRSKNLLHEAFPDAKVNIETSVVFMEGPVTEVAETAAGFFYASFILPPETHRIMLSSYLIFWRYQNRVETLKEKDVFSMPINRIVVRK